MLTGGICLTGESELANVECWVIYGMPQHWASGRGEGSDDTFPVSADYFSSTNTWDQNIWLYVRLKFKCELFLVLLKVLSGSPAPL